MSKLIANLNDGTKELVVVLQNISTDEGLKLLLQDPDAKAPVVENTVVQEFLTRTGLQLFVETPQSSNIKSMSFDAVAEEIVFTFDNDTQVRYPSSLSRFLSELGSPSFGKLQWAYRRENEPPSVGDKVKVISTADGAGGAVGYVGTVTALPPNNGRPDGLRVRFEGMSYPSGIWGLGKGAVVERVS